MLNDPGKTLVKGKPMTKGEKRAARMGAWTKPAKKVDRDKLRADRIADYERLVGPLPRKGGQK